MWEENFIFLHFNPCVDRIRWYGRYIDDLILVRNNSGSVLSPFISYLNNNHLNLEYPHEVPEVLTIWILLLLAIPLQVLFIPALSVKNLQAIFCYWHLVAIINTPFTLYPLEIYQLEETALIQAASLGNAIQSPPG